MSLKTVWYVALLFLVVSASCFFHPFVVVNFGYVCGGYLIGYILGGILKWKYEPDPEDPVEADVEEIDGIKRAA